MSTKSEEIERVYLSECCGTFGNSSENAPTLIPDRVPGIPATQAIPPAIGVFISKEEQEQLKQEHADFHEGQEIFNPKCWLCQVSLSRREAQIKKTNDVSEFIYQDELERTRISLAVHISVEAGRKVFLGTYPDFESAVMAFDLCIGILDLPVERLRIPSGYPPRLKEKLENVEVRVKEMLVRKGLLPWQFSADKQKSPAKKENTTPDLIEIPVKVKKPTEDLTPLSATKFRKHAKDVAEEWARSLGLDSVSVQEFKEEAPLRSPYSGKIYKRNDFR